MSKEEDNDVSVISSNNKNEASSSKNSQVFG